MKNKNTSVMEIEIRINIPEEGTNIIDKSTFSLSVVGMPIKNREALKTLPDKIRQSFIDSVELLTNNSVSDRFINCIDGIKNAPLAPVQAPQCNE